MDHESCPKYHKIKKSNQLRKKKKKEKKVNEETNPSERRSKSANPWTITVLTFPASVAAKSCFRWEPGLPKKPVLDGAAEWAYALNLLLKFNIYFWIGSKLRIGKYECSDRAHFFQFPVTVFIIITSSSYIIQVLVTWFVLCIFCLKTHKKTRKDKCMTMQISANVLHVN